MILLLKQLAFPKFVNTMPQFCSLMWEYNWDNGIVSTTNVPFARIHQTVGVTGTNLTIVSSNHSTKMLANAGEIGEPVAKPTVIGDHGNLKIVAFTQRSPSGLLLSHGA